VKDPRRAVLLAVVLGLAVAGCRASAPPTDADLRRARDDEQHAVVTTAQGSVQPWACPEAATKMTRVSDATYRLRGCGAEATYVCNFAFVVPRCWQP